MRQRLLLKLSRELGFPLGQIAVEVPLRQLPHLTLQDRRQIPARRADILCYGADAGFFPLLLVECKAVDLNAGVIRQTIGYNQYVQARYVAIANQDGEQLGWLDTRVQQYVFHEGLLDYSQLLQKI